jgi:hypothetical protein
MPARLSTWIIAAIRVLRFGVDVEHDLDQPGGNRVSRRKDQSARGIANLWGITPVQATDRRADARCKSCLAHRVTPFCGHSWRTCLHRRDMNPRISQAERVAGFGAGRFQIPLEVGIVDHEGDHGVSNQLAGNRVARKVSATHDAAMGVVVGAGEDGVPLFRNDLDQRQSFEITDGGVVAGVRVVRCFRGRFADGLQRSVEVIRARTPEEVLGGTDDDTLVGTNMVGKGRGNREGGSCKFVTEHIPEDKDVFLSFVGPGVSDLIRGTGFLDAMELSELHARGGGIVRGRPGKQRRRVELRRGDERSGARGLSEGQTA